MKAAPLEPEIVTRNGKPVSVILPIKKYAELLERVEDSENLAWLRKAREKPLSYRPLEEYVWKTNGGMAAGRPNPKDGQRPSLHGHQITSTSRITN
jgi:antitoxin (DNA-binding transcriptional repressor) of toxin-antitoxin stability system